jgi:hypothetical protein
MWSGDRRLISKQLPLKLLNELLCQDARPRSAGVTPRERLYLFVLSIINSCCIGRDHPLGSALAGDLPALARERNRIYAVALENNGLGMSACR